jgi:ubiquinol-cytochrome c reductase iron-sulfur subunit
MASALGALLGLGTGAGRRPRIVPPGEPDTRAELAVVVLLALATICAAGFIYVLATGSLPNRTQFEGIALGLALAFTAAALILISKRLIVTEELEEEYPAPEHRQEQAAISQLVRESGSPFTRKRLLKGAAGAAAGALGLAFIAPAVGLGPAFDTDELLDTPWRRGRRLVSEDGAPLRAGDVEQGAFYTAYPEHAARDEVGAPLIVVRLEPSALKLPRGRRGWAPQGIVAYSKICTHAGCAIALYRKPTFPPVEPRPAFVCPCHYSTFDPASGGKVLFGPAGRDLPQLPLMIDPSGDLRAAGNFSGPPGPSWWGVRLSRARARPS